MGRPRPVLLVLCACERVWSMPMTAGSLPAAAAPVMSTLRSIGVPRDLKEELCFNVAREQWTWEGAEYRALQWSYRVTSGEISQPELLQILTTQPEALRLGDVRKKIVHEDDRFLAINKPWALAEDEAVRRAVADRPTERDLGYDNLCCGFPLNAYGSGIVLAAKSMDAAAAVDGCDRGGHSATGAEALHAVVVLGHPEWESVNLYASPQGHVVEGHVAARGELRQQGGIPASLLWLVSRPWIPDDGAVLAALTQLNHPVLGTPDAQASLARSGLSHPTYRLLYHQAGLTLPTHVAPRTKMLGGVRVPVRNSAGVEEPLRVLAPLTPEAWRDIFKPKQEVASPPYKKWGDAAIVVAGVNWRKVL